jgi:hypothetical protein
MFADWNQLPEALQIALSCEALHRASAAIAAQAEVLADEMECGSLADRGGPDALRSFGWAGRTYLRRPVMREAAPARRCHGHCQTLVGPLRNPWPAKLVSVSSMPISPWSGRRSASVDGRASAAVCSTRSIQAVVRGHAARSTPVRDHRKLAKCTAMAMSAIAGASQTKPASGATFSR